MTVGLDAAQRASFREHGYLVLPGFVTPQDCLRLRERAIELAREKTAVAANAVVFRTDAPSPHASSSQFLASGSGIHAFYEQGAFDAAGRLQGSGHTTAATAPHQHVDGVDDLSHRGSAMACRQTDDARAGP